MFFLQTRSKWNYLFIYSKTIFVRYVIPHWRVHSLFKSILPYLRTVLSRCVHTCKYTLKVLPLSDARSTEKSTDFFFFLIGLLCIVRRISLCTSNVYMFRVSPLVAWPQLGFLFDLVIVNCLGRYFFTCFNKYFFKCWMWLFSVSSFGSCRLTPCQ